MSRPTVSLLVLGVALVLVAAFTVWSRRPLYFCEAAETPAAYQNEWFYRLHAGPAGWLLRDDDLTTTATLQPSTLAYLTRLTDALAAQGVTLILAAQPPRGVALPPESLPGYDPGAALARYAEVRSALEATGLHVTDLGSVATETPDYFFRRDHHWTPDGAEASAQAVADTVRATDAYAQLEPGRFATETAGREEQLGSFGEAIGRICGRNPPAERLTHYRTTAQTVLETNLFRDAPAPPLTLVGTSNSAREDLNFAGFLEQATGLDVLNAAATGGGPQAALGSYLRSETFHEATPSFIVWEFATLFDIPQDPLFYRQVIPSVKGACAAAAVTHKLDGTSINLFDSSRLFDSPRSGHNLYLEFSDLSVKSFGLELHYRNGRSETLELRRSGREANDGSYFLELLGQPARITLTLPEGATGDVQARLCP